MKGVLRLLIIILSVILPMNLFSSPISLGYDRQDVYAFLPDIFGPDTNFGPQTADDQLKRDPVYLDLDHARLMASSTQPTKVYMTIRGYLLSACHHLRVKVTQADPQNSIKLEVYSVVNEQAQCTTELKPFSTTVSLGSFSKGYHTLFINGELLGKFYVGDGPKLINA